MRETLPDPRWECLEALESPLAEEWVSRAKGPWAGATPGARLVESVAAALAAFLCFNHACAGLGDKAASLCISGGATLPAAAAPFPPCSRAFACSPVRLPLRFSSAVEACQSGCRAPGSTQHWVCVRVGSPSLGKGVQWQSCDCPLLFLGFLGLVRCRENLLLGSGWHRAARGWLDLGTILFGFLRLLL